MIDENELKRRLEGAIGRHIGHAGKVIFCRLGRNLADAGYEVNPEQMIMLAHVYLSEGINQQSLSQHIHRDKAAATRLIDSLEKKNLVIRVSDKTDRRQNMIFLTNEGKEMVLEVSEVAEKTHAEALVGVTEEEVSTLKRVLDKIRENLES
ncbi:MAG: MarR family transcriptional regulator [candidate division Zixibacteria bacterium]|nr:MarR family transcriptional regulator [candidate division Zixibacteria bacterium]